MINGLPPTPERLGVIRPLDYSETDGIYRFVDSGSIILATVDAETLDKIRDEVVDNEKNDTRPEHEYEFHRSASDTALSYRGSERLGLPKKDRATDLANELFKLTAGIPGLSELSFSTRGLSSGDDDYEPHVEFDHTEGITDGYLAVLAYPHNTLYAPEGFRIEGNEQIIDGDGNILEPYATKIALQMTPAQERQMRLLSLHGTLHCGRAGDDSLLIRMIL